MYFFSRNENDRKSRQCAIKYYHCTTYWHRIRKWYLGHEASTSGWPSGGFWMKRLLLTAALCFVLISNEVDKAMTDYSQYGKARQRLP